MTKNTMTKKVYESMLNDIHAIAARKDFMLSDEYDVYGCFLRGRMNLQFCLCGSGTKSDPLYINPELYVLGDEYDYGSTAAMNYALVDFFYTPKSVDGKPVVEDEPDSPCVYIDPTGYMPDFVTADELTNTAFEAVPYEEFCRMAEKLLADIAEAHPEWDEDMTECWSAE